MHFPGRLTIAILAGAVLTAPALAQQAGNGPPVPQVQPAPQAPPLPPCTFSDGAWTCNAAAFPTGAAGGDLSGSYPDPSVTGLTHALITPSGGSVASSPAALWGRTVNVLDYGAKCDGTTPDQTYIQAAINAVGIAGGGTVIFPPQTCLISATLQIHYGGVTLLGGGNHATTLLCETGSSDCIDALGTSASDQIYGVHIDDMQISGSGLTGGTMVSFRFVAQSGLQNVVLSQPYNGFSASGTNDILLFNVDENSTNTGAFGYKWYSAVAGERSDVLDMIHVTANLNFKGGDCYQWDGNTDTLWMSHVNALGCNDGLHIEDTSGSTTQYPVFLQAFDFEVDAAKGFALVTDNYADQIYCDQCQLTAQGGSDFAVGIQSNTAEVTISNSRILSGAGTEGVGVYSGAQDVILANNNYRGSATGNVINNSGATISFIGGIGYNGAVITVTSCATGTTC